MLSRNPNTERAEKSGLSPWLALTLVLALLANLLCLSAPLGWPGEIACHFGPHLALANLPLLALLLRRRAWRWSLLLSATSVGCAYPWLQLHWSSPSPAPKDPTWNAISANLWWGSPAGQALPEWLASSKPDIVFLCDLDPRSRAALLQWAPAQGFVETWIWPPSEQWNKYTVGRALLARQPFDSRQVLWPGPVLEAHLKFSGRMLRVLGAHPPSPGEGWRTAPRNRVLTHLADLCHGDPAVLLLGDLNSTEASPSFQALLSHGGLLDTRSGRGWYPTWRVQVPGLNRPLLGLRLPLDHILHGAALASSSRGLGPDLGSDHLPVEARIGWR
jgi:endonuclease/exonuclease/phosphatase family metal-dependent hydrolase